MLRVVTTRHDPAGRQATLDRVEQALAAAGIGIEQDLTVDTLQSALDGHVLVLAEALIAIAAVVAFVGMLGLTSTMSTNVIERTREFAVLHVIGAAADDRVDDRPTGLPDDFEALLWFHLPRACLTGAPGAVGPPRQCLRHSGWPGWTGPMR